MIGQPATLISYFKSQQRLLKISTPHHRVVLSTKEKAAQNELAVVITSHIGVLKILQLEGKSIIFNIKFAHFIRLKKKEWNLLFFKLIIFSEVHTLLRESFIPPPLSTPNYRSIRLKLVSLSLCRRKGFQVRRLLELAVLLGLG